MARKRSVAATKPTRTPARRKGKPVKRPARPAPPARAPRTPLLGASERRSLAKRLPGWRIRGKRLVREAKVKDFDSAMAFVYRVAELAQRADHHPDLHVTDYRTVRIELWSHDAGGLSVRDFSLAEEIDGLPGAWR